VAYDRTVQALVRGWKEHGLRTIGGLAEELVAEVVPTPRARVVTWVPPDRDRLLRRGHSTSEQLARLLAARWRAEAAPLVVRTRPVAQQRGLDLASRRRNVAGAFRARESPARVVLVDDVYTSGATVSAASTALRTAGATEVTVVTFARTLR
jgi:predicted amidophosphoribosyltransferase